MSAQGLVTVFPDLTGPSAYTGAKLTNALGFIRRDATFSVVDANIVTEATDCSCYVKRQKCLKLACDLDSQNGTSCLTTPLVDPATGEPFKVPKGTMICEVVVAKRKGICVDPNAGILLGVIRDTNDDCCADHCAQRWISESNCLCGSLINSCCVLKVDPTCNCKACCLFEVDDCNAGSHCDGCGEVEDDCECGTPGPTDPPCTPECLDPKMKLQKKTGLCLGESDDIFLAITVVAGVIKEHDISFSVELYEQANCSCPCDFGNPFDQPAQSCTLFRAH